MISRWLSIWICLLSCTGSLLYVLNGRAEEARPGKIQSIGIYTSPTVPAQTLAFFKACGYNTYECWDMGWETRPALHEKYYAEMAQAVGRIQAAGFRVHVLLSLNLLQRRGDEPRTAESMLFDPNDSKLVEQRLDYVAKAVGKLKLADGFIIFAGDPGGHAKARISQFREIADRMVQIVRREAPRAEVCIDPWSIAAWDHLPSPFAASFWDKETQFTRELIDLSGPYGPSVNVEFPLHNYYRSLALKCYADAGREPEPFPTARDIASLRERGVKRVWGWPYFLTDECDDGYKGTTSGLAQSETRYIKRIIEIARRLGLDGMIANAFETNIFAETLNLYAFPRFCQDPNVMPEQVIDDFAGLISEPKTATELGQVLRFIENHSTWQAGLPEKNRLPNFDVGTMKSAQDARAALARIVARKECPLPLAKSPGEYLQKLDQRLGILAEEETRGKPAAPK